LSSIWLAFYSKKATLVSYPRVTVRLVQNNFFKSF
jgi:hypothetical protein